MDRHDIKLIGHAHDGHAYSLYLRFVTTFCLTYTVYSIWHLHVTVANNKTLDRVRGY